MLKEFKEFALRGNVMDLAIGVIIGAAFGKIVGALIDDLIMPLVGKVVGSVDFSNLYVPLSEKVTKAIQDSPTGTLALADARKLGAVFAYGDFITVLLNFVILAFCIFMMIKIMNKIVKKQEAAVPPPTTSEKLLTEIRDLLNKK